MPNTGSAFHLSPFAGPVLLVAPAIPVVAALTRAATRAPIPTAARLAAPTALTATDVTVTVSSTSGAEFTAVPMAAPPLLTEAIRFDVLGLCAARTDSGQRRRCEGSAGELYRPTPRDRASVQTHRQVVKWAHATSFISFLQQRDSSLPHHAPQQLCLHTE